MMTYQGSREAEVTLPEAFASNHIVNTPVPCQPERSGQVGEMMLRPAEVPNASVEGGESFPVTGGDLPPDELDFLARFRALGTVPRLAIRRYLTADDDRLVVAIYLQAFLGVRPR
jgi:hypothetical protein